MDLISHIAGVGPTAAFNPGATTPAPYNAPQVGATDGTGPANATKNMAEIYNRDLLWRRALIANAGLVFDPTNWIQEVAAIEAMIAESSIQYCTAGGTADAITGNFTPDVVALGGPMTLYVRAAYANATTNPTFQADATAAKTIVKGHNLPLVAGDISGAGHWLQLQFDLTLDKWVLLNPAIPFGGFANLLAANGYQRLPGGALLQWGQSSSSASAAVTVTFPVAYTAPPRAFVVPVYGSGILLGALVESAPGLTSFPVGQFTSSNARSAQSFHWFSIGY